MRLSISLIMFIVTLVLSCLVSELGLFQVSCSETDPYLNSTRIWGILFRPGRRFWGHPEPKT